MRLGSISAKCAACRSLLERGGRCAGLAHYESWHCPMRISRMTEVLYCGGRVLLTPETKRQKTLSRLKAQHPD